MFDLHSPHLNPQVTELSIQLLLHLHSFLFELVLKFAGVETLNVNMASFDLIKSVPHVLSHLLHGFKLFEQLTGLLPCLEDFVGGVSSNFFQLLLGEED